MEPLFFKAENAQKKRHTRRRGACPASMEPLFFKAENPVQPNRELALTEVLQWSRFFSKRKMFSGINGERNTSSFNGAAFFQSGK